MSYIAVFSQKGFLEMPLSCQLVKGSDFMLFHTFSSQKERRNFGGSCFVEFQYCTLSGDKTLNTIVNEVNHWNNSSLYLHGDDMNEFLNSYKEIFTNGCYNNGEYGIVDMYGINYYSPQETANIIEKLKKNKPKDYEFLIQWLEKSEKFNGFYILGI